MPAHNRYCKLGCRAAAAILLLCAAALLLQCAKGAKTITKEPRFAVLTAPRLELLARENDLFTVIKIGSRKKYSVQYTLASTQDPKTIIRASSEEITLFSDEASAREFQTSYEPLAGAYIKISQNFALRAEPSLDGPQIATSSPPRALKPVAPLFLPPEGTLPWVCVQEVDAQNSSEYASADEKKSSKKTKAQKGKLTSVPAVGECLPPRGWAMADPSWDIFYSKDMPSAPGRLLRVVRDGAQSQQNPVAWMREADIDALAAGAVPSSALLPNVQDIASYAQMSVVSEGGNVSSAAEKYFLQQFFGDAPNTSSSAPNTPSKTKPTIQPNSDGAFDDLALTLLLREARSTEPYKIPLSKMLSARPYAAYDLSSFMLIRWTFPSGQTSFPAVEIIPEGRLNDVDTDAEQADASMRYIPVPLRTLKERAQAFVRTKQNLRSFFASPARWSSALFGTIRISRITAASINSAGGAYEKEMAWLLPRESANARIAALRRAGELRGVLRWDYSLPAGGSFDAVLVLSPYAKDDAGPYTAPNIVFAFTTISEDTFSLQLIDGLSSSSQGSYAQANDVTRGQKTSGTIGDTQSAGGTNAIRTSGPIMTFSRIAYP